MRLRLQQTALCLLATATVALTSMPVAQAQPGLGAPGAARSARESALLDLSGQWVAVINEDWRWRMMTAPVGDTLSLPINAEGRRVAAAWDLDKDRAEGNLCRAFGAPGLIRQPTRIRIDWQDDNTLRLAFDAGQQERLLHFNSSLAPGEHSLQGFSTAAWYRQRLSRGVLGAGPGTPGGSLHVATSHLAMGYLRPNGVPYSDQASMKEYISSFTLSGNGDSWLIVTTIMQDPVYFSGELVMSTQFKKERDQAGWDPRPCDIQPPRVVRPPTVPGPFG
jgi:hypothetical protein